MKVGLYWVFVSLLAGSFLPLRAAAAGPPWCPVQIGTAGYVSTGPTAGIRANNSTVSPTFDPNYPDLKYAGVYNMDRSSMSPLFGSAYCIDNGPWGNPASSGVCSTDAQPESIMKETDLTTEDQLCPNPIKHTMIFSAHFSGTTRLKGGAERTDCNNFGKPDLHGHCVVNQCQAGVLRAEAFYSLGQSQTNGATTSCVQPAGGSPCEVTYKASGSVIKRLVAGQTNYFQQGQYLETGNLCSVNQGPPPATVASIPADACGAGFDVYVDPSTGLARCVSPGTGTPNPSDPSGTGGGSSSAWPTSCPTWLSAICGWFAETDSGAETLAAQRSGRVSDPNAVATTLPESNIQVNEQMVGTSSPFFSTRYLFAGGCPANPEISMMGGGTFIIPYNRVCDFGQLYIKPASGILSFLIAIGIAFRGSSA